MNGMMLKKELQPGCDIYLVLDAQVAGYDTLLEKASLAIMGGVGILQLRDKNGSDPDILSFSRRIRKIIPREVPYIINDRIDLVLEAGADGLHIGQEDISLKEARRRLGEDTLVGISCQTLEQALEAQENGADYIGFGSVYRTQTKPTRPPMDLRLLEEVLDRITIPFFAIGGINIQNVRPLIELGVTRVAVTRAVLEAEDVEGMVKEFREILCGRSSMVEHQLPKLRT
jgi:thiamine-phosphate pyrophosphorylase